MIKSLPNAITLFRTAASLIIPLLMLQGDEITRWAALILYALAAGTDWLDGTIAELMPVASNIRAKVQFEDGTEEIVSLGSCPLTLFPLWGPFSP